MKRRAACALTLLSPLLLSACGFQLRGSNGEYRIPFKTMYIGVPETSSLGNELKRNIRALGGTEVVSDPKEAEALLQVISEVRSNKILSLNSQGRVREYSLYYTLSFHVTNKHGKELLAPTVITLRRDLSFNESEVMAKEQEEAMLYRDMQSDLVQQILRRLTALKPAQ